MEWWGRGATYTDLNVFHAYKYHLKRFLNFASKFHLHKGVFIEHNNANSWYRLLSPIYGIGSYHSTVNNVPVYNRLMVKV